MLALSAGCSGPSDAGSTPAEPSDTRRVLLAGDSITEGYYATTPDDGFAALLLDGWDAEGLRVEEAGARAWRIARAVDDLHDQQPGTTYDVAVLEVGANDVGKTPVREWAVDYRELVVAAERGDPALVVCLGPWNDAARSAPYDRVVGRICDGDGRVHAPLSDLYDDPALHGPVGAATDFGARDAFHPGDDGHAAIAARVAEVVDRARIAPWPSTPPDSTSGRSSTRTSPAPS